MHSSTHRYCYCFMYGEAKSEGRKGKGGWFSPLLLVPSSFQFFRIQILQNTEHRIKWWESVFLQRVKPFHRIVPSIVCAIDTTFWQCVFKLEETNDAGQATKVSDSRYLRNSMKNLAQFFYNGSRLNYYKIINFIQFKAEKQIPLWCIWCRT